MPLEPRDRAAFCARQAEFTRGIRYHVYRLIALANLAKVLDVGSGTGLIAEEIGKRASSFAVALDREPAPGRGVLRVRGDALLLPFQDSSFDGAVCHFVLMWLSDPVSAVQEMKRVVRPGGWVAALAEPDYGGYVDYPDEVRIGTMLADALRSEGADPDLGRKLRSIFSRAGLRARVGLSAGMWDIEKLAGEFDSEWSWRFKLLGRSPELEELKRREEKAISEGERVLFMPIFWAAARKH